jgi:hypothetical protein
LNDGEVNICLSTEFSLQQLHQQFNFYSLFYYYGILTAKCYRQGLSWYSIPNRCVKERIMSFKGSELVRTEHIAEEQM